jgi:hypothetical protein
MTGIARRAWRWFLRVVLRRRPGFRRYDPSRVAVTWNGVEIQGHMDGTFIEREADRSRRQPPKQGSITVTLVSGPGKVE